MSPVVMAILVLSLYLVFYRFYARGPLGRRVFALVHDAVLAGLAPMLGPAIAGAAIGLFEVDGKPAA